MTIIRAFNAIRPIKEVADKIILEISKCGEIGNDINRMIAKGLFVDDEKQCMYIYRSVSNETSRTGLICCVSIDDYIQNNIIRHENTRLDKENNLVKNLECQRVCINPVLLTYKQNSQVSRVVKKWSEKKPVYDFTTKDMVRHTIWVIDEDRTINKLVNLFSYENNIYIADGHHRVSAFSEIAMRKRQNGFYKGEGNFNFFPSILIPTNELNIHSYYTLVKDLNGLSSQQFINEIEKKFDIILLDDDNTFTLEKKHVIGMYLDGRCYKIIPRKHSCRIDNQTNTLDVSILYDNILKPILGIYDEKTDDRIEFIEGVESVNEIFRIVNTSMKLAFFINSVSVDEIIKICEEGKMMPPKSTYIEPKLVDGMFIYRFI